MQKFSCRTILNIGFSMVFLIGVVLFFPSCATLNLGPTIGPLKEKVVSGKGETKVLLVDIHGLITNMEKRSLTGNLVKIGLVERIREILEKAKTDDTIKALLVRINSPGGTVTASDMIYHDLRAFKKKRNLQIYVSVMDMAASGGYYIAMAGDKIMVHPTSLIGSIGVIALKINLQGLLEKVGVDWEVVKSGAKKDFMSPLRPFTDEERKLFQATIDNFHHRFVNVIAENRSGLDVSQVETLADGRVYGSQEALDSKLIDKIGYLDDTLDLIKTDLGVSDLKVVTYHRSGEYKSNLYSSFNNPPTINFLNIDLGLNLEITVPKFMYLWMP